MSESEDCDVFLAEMPSKGELVMKITSTIEELEKRGVSEVEELNITAIDLSSSERINIK